jgi:hypothetical protein
LCGRDAVNNQIPHSLHHIPIPSETPRRPYHVLAGVLAAAVMMPCRNKTLCRKDTICYLNCNTLGLLPRSSEVKCKEIMADNLRIFSFGKCEGFCEDRDICCDTFKIPHKTRKQKLTLLLLLRSRDTNQHVNRTPQQPPAPPTTQQQKQQQQQQQQQQHPQQRKQQQQQQQEPQQQPQKYQQHRQLT